MSNMMKVTIHTDKTTAARKNWYLPLWPGKKCDGTIGIIRNALEAMIAARDEERIVVINTNTVRDHVACKDVLNGLVRFFELEIKDSEA